MYLSQLTLETGKPSLACQPAYHAEATISTELADAVDLSLVAETAGSVKRRSDEERRVDVRDHIVSAPGGGGCAERGWWYRSKMGNVGSLPGLCSLFTSAAFARR